MYVKDHMTREPVTITKDVKISKAVDIMSKGHFHRLPIVDDSGKLVGLVTGGLVTEKSGANATSLSIYELNYLLSKTSSLAASKRSKRMSLSKKPRRK